MALCQQEDLLVDRFELLFEPKFTTLGQLITEDIAAVASLAAVDADRALPPAAADPRRRGYWKGRRCWRHGFVA